MSNLANIHDMVETGARKTREYRTTKPVHIRKLAGRLENHTAVGDAIGVTSATISKYLSEDSATLPMEMAAQFVYERDFPEWGGAKKEVKLVAALVQGELHHIKTLQDMIVALGGKFSFVNFDGA